MATVENETMVYDRAGALKRLQGNQDLATRVTTAFLVDIPHQIQVLRGLLEMGDAAGSGRQAHRIKGAAATVGGERLRKVAFEMEKAADTGDLGAVNNRMVELETQFFRLSETMKEEQAG